MAKKAPVKSAEPVQPTEPVQPAEPVQLVENDVETAPENCTGLVGTGKFGGTKYPWDEWFAKASNSVGIILRRSEGPENDKGSVLDGKETVKRHYNVPVDGMPPKIRTALRRRYLFGKIFRKDENGNKFPKGGLVVRDVRPMTDEEKLAENIRRAEEKEALKNSKKSVTTPSTDEQDAV